MRARMGSPELLTREQIISRFPPKEEVFSKPDGSTYSEWISRNPDGKIIYRVPPGSIVSPSTIRTNPPAK